MWKNILVGVPQGPVLGPLLFSIYVNDLPTGIELICKIFADDTSLFSIAKDKTFSDTQRNNNLNKTSKCDNENYPLLVFNDAKVQFATSQKHLGLILDFKLDFNDHTDSKINKCNKIIGIIKILSLTLSRKSLLTIYKSFARPNLDYADLIYDKPFNESIFLLISKKIEMVQCKAALVITDAIKGTSRDRLYQEFGLESLSDKS